MYTLTLKTSIFCQEAKFICNPCANFICLTLKYKKTYNSTSFYNRFTDIEKTTYVVPGLQKNNSAWLFLHLIMKE